MEGRASVPLFRFRNRRAAAICILLLGLLPAFMILGGVSFLLTLSIQFLCFWLLTKVRFLTIWKKALLGLNLSTFVVARSKIRFSPIWQLSLALGMLIL